MTTTDTACRKCGAPMKPMPDTIGGRHTVFIVTGYRCDCGHWNDLDRREKIAKKKVDA